MKNKFKLIITTLLVLILFFSVLVFKVLQYNSLKVINEKCEISSYVSSVDIYLKLNNYKVKKTDQKVLKENCEIIKKMYLSGRVTYGIAEEFINDISKIRDLNDYAKNSKEYIEELKMSEAAYNNGLESLENDQYRKAISQFGSVLTYDSRYYKKSLEEIKYAVSEAEKTKKYTIDDCSIAYSNSKLKQLYKDQIQIKLTNNFDKEIKNFDICFIAYDKNNKPVIINNETNYNKNYYISCIGQDVNIKPYSHWGDGSMGWNIDDSSNIYSITAEIKEIEFEDGEVWNNPLFYMWLDRSLENVW